MGQVLAPSTSKDDFDIELEKEIRKTLISHDFKIDVEYWEKVLKRLEIKAAKEYLKDLAKEY